MSITLPDGTVYDAASFVQVNNTGLGGAAIPRGDFIITLAGDYLDGKSPTYVTVTVDGSLTFRANQDRANSYDPLFYMYRYHIQEADYGAHDPMVRSTPSPTATAPAPAPGTGAETAICAASPAPWMPPCRTR